MFAKPYKILLVIILLFIISSFAFLKFAAPDLIVEALQNGLRQKCASCELKVKHAQVSLFPSLMFDLTGVSFERKKLKHSTIVIQIKNAHAGLEILPVFKEKAVVIDSLELQNVQALLIEVDAPPSPKSKESSPSSDWNLSILKTTIIDSGFRYVRNTHNTSATLNIRKIEMNVGELNNLLVIKEAEEVRVKASAQIEKSGSVDIDLKIMSFQNPLTLNLALQIENQNLEDLTPFFKENAGVTLKGILLKGKSQSFLKGNDLKASVWAKYQNFDVELMEHFDRSDLTAFFMNLGKSIVVSKDNKEKDPLNQQKSILLKQDKGESVVHFIFRGMKEAALGVTKL